MPLEFAACRFQYRRGPEVLGGLDFAFPQGRTVLLGPNGAGKSTLLALAASALAAQSGKVTFDDLDPAVRSQRRAYRRRVGWMPQQITAMPGMTVREQVAYSGWLKGMARSEAWTRSSAVLDEVGLADKTDHQASALSGGQQRRMGVAQTLVHSAQLVLMDEPTAGLDPAQRAAFRGVVGQLAEHADVIVSTHQTEDLADVYDHVVVLYDGEVRFCGTVAAFAALAPTATEPARTAEAAYQATLREGALR